MVDSFSFNEEVEHIPTRDALSYLENNDVLNKLDQHFYDLDTNEQINEIMTWVNEIGTTV